MLVYANYNDWAKQTNKGETPIGIIGLEFDNASPLMTDLPLTEATGETVDEGTFEAPYKPDAMSYTSDFNGFYHGSKGDTYSRKDYMGMRKGAVSFREGDKELMGAGFNDLRMLETKRHVRSMALDWERAFIYGNPNTDVKAILGLANRYSYLTDEDGIVKAGAHAGELSPYVTISAGGTGNNLTSVYVMVAGADAVTRIFPKKLGFEMGIRYRPGEWHEETGRDELHNNEDGFRFVLNDRFDSYLGYSIRHARACFRIANIDTNSAEGIKNFVHAMYVVCDLLDQSFKDREIYLYGNRKLRIAMKEHYNSLVQPISYDSSKPMNMRGDFYFGDVLFRLNDNIINTESAIV